MLDCKAHPVLCDFFQCFLSEQQSFLGWKKTYRSFTSTPWFYFTENQSSQKWNELPKVTDLVSGKARSKDSGADMFCPAIPSVSCIVLIIYFITCDLPGKEKSHQNLAFP